MKKTLHKLGLIATIVTFAFSINACSKTETETEITETETTTQEIAEYEKGIVTESSFESEWLDLKFTLPEGFVMSTEDELNSLMGEENGYVDESASSEVEDVNTYYEMMAADVNTGANVLITIEELAFSNITVDQYIDSLKTQLEGYSYTLVGDITTETVAGNEYTKLNMQTSQEDVTINQYYLMRKIDDKIAGFIITIPETSPAELYNTILDSFSSLKL